MTKKEILKDVQEIAQDELDVEPEKNHNDYQHQRGFRRR